MIVANYSSYFIHEEELLLLEYLQRWSQLLIRFFAFRREFFIIVFIGPIHERM